MQNVLVWFDKDTKVIQGYQEFPIPETLPENAVFTDAARKDEIAAVIGVGTVVIDEHGVASVPADLTAQIAAAEEAKADELAHNTRDSLFRKHEWRITRNQREIRLGLTPTETTESLDTYFHALADITTQAGYPLSIQWPEEPNG